VAICGASYGGYAAMMSLTDLPWILRVWHRPQRTIRTAHMAGRSAALQHENERRGGNVVADARHVSRRGCSALVRSRRSTGPIGSHVRCSSRTAATDPAVRSASRIRSQRRSGVAAARSRTSSIPMKATSSRVGEPRRPLRTHRSFLPRTLGGRAEPLAGDRYPELIGAGQDCRMRA